MERWTVTERRRNDAGSETVPFCGKEAKTMNLISDLFIVGCDYNPNCPGHIGKCAPAYYTEELAIKYWNRRAGDPDGKT